MVPIDISKIPETVKYCTLMLGQLEFLMSFVNDLLDL